MINAAANNGMMRNIYQNSARQYPYQSASAINSQINGIGRYAQMSSMAAAAAAAPYSSMAAQFSSMQNPSGNMNIRQENLSFSDHMLHYQSY